MTISATIIADSRSENLTRLTTMELRYPRFIHAEVMTHRMFSRNASSSRAIPVERLIADVMSDPAMPIHWGKNQRGMQAKKEHDALIEGLTPEQHWLKARDQAVEMALQFSLAGYHKQVVNRLLEPFAHINVIVTATDWANFFTQRLHEDAQPEIHELARQMHIAMEHSRPKIIPVGQWHLPYVTESGDISVLKRVSAARCARVSYKTHDGRTPSVEEDLALFDNLATAEPRHLSPLEHVCTPGKARGRRANLRDWVQLRKDYE